MNIKPTKQPGTTRNLVLLLLFLFFYNGLQADSLRRTTSAEPPCDTLYLSNGKAVAVTNLRFTETELFFSYCTDTLQQIVRAPLLQVQRIKKADGTWIEGRSKKKSLPEEKSTYNQADQDLSDELNRLFLLSLLGQFLLPIATQILIFRQAKKLRKKLDSSPNAATFRRRLRLLVVMNSITLCLWIYLFILIIPTLKALWWFFTALIHDAN